MARESRKARAAKQLHLNLELAGIAAFVLAFISGIALWTPAHSGALGAALARGLGAGFGSAAWLVPILIALLGGIVFLEINVPRTIAREGFAAFCYFVLADAFYGRSGGAFGALLHDGFGVFARIDRNDGRAGVPHPRGDRVDYGGFSEADDRPRDRDLRATARLRDGTRRAG